MKRPAVYLETSVISYLTSRESRDLIVSGHQYLTRKFWEKHRQNFKFHISSFVLEEIRRGEPAAAALRLDFARPLFVLRTPNEALSLAESYISEKVLPDSAAPDGLHIATAALCQMDYLLTWNCRHICCAELRRRLEAFHRERKIHFPVVCTPEELMWS